MLSKLVSMRRPRTSKSVWMGHEIGVEDISIGIESHIAEIDDELACAVQQLVVGAESA